MGLTLFLALVLACPSLALASKPQAAQAEKSQLPEPVAQAFKQANIPLSAVSIVVAPLSTVSPNTALPKPRLSLHANAEMNPASVMKLITTSAGLVAVGSRLHVAQS
jgi:serine-type D-Ala-D-Ala carboxypeptidase/endopeptidase (penicillin-binding protein 4)